MTRATITITEHISRTYVLTDAQLEEIDLPADADALSATDEDTVAEALLESDLEDRYAVEDRSVEIAVGQ